MIYRSTCELTWNTIFPSENQNLTCWFMDDLWYESSCILCTDMINGSSLKYYVSQDSDWKGTVIETFKSGLFINIKNHQMPFPSLFLNLGLSSFQVSQAHTTLSHILRNATQALQSRSDPTHIQFHQNASNHDVMPILHALETMAKERELSLAWVLECTAHFRTLLHQLNDAHQTAVGKWVNQESGIVVFW